jgi:hypothetical protein
VRFGGAAQTVVGLSGTLVRLAGQDGQASVVQLAHLLASEGFEIIGGAGQMRPPLSAAALGGVPGDAAGDALQWERHIVQVLTGAVPDAPPGTAPRPGYDPAAYSLAQREQAKAAELAASGEKVTARTVKRKRQRYQARGVAGLVDWRADRARPARGRTDERVVQALQQAISEQAAGSTRTASFYLSRTRQILAGQYGPGVVPMPRTPIMSMRSSSPSGVARSSNRTDHGSHSPQVTSTRHPSCSTAAVSSRSQRATIRRA